MGRAATGKAVVCYLTYGSRTVNRTDSLYQTVSGLVGKADWGESLTVCRLRISRPQHHLGTHIEDKHWSIVTTFDTYVEEHWEQEDVVHN